MVFLSTFHALLFLGLFRFRFDAFPVQVRLSYLLWVSIGTYIPGMIILMHITTVGLAANLFFSQISLTRCHVCKYLNFGPQWGANRK